MRALTDFLPFPQLNILARRLVKGSGVEVSGSVLINGCAAAFALVAPWTHARHRNRSESSRSAAF